MPYKANEPRRHKIPKARYRVENWSANDAALRRRGDLTIWRLAERVNDCGLLASFGDQAARRKRRLRRSKLARPNI